MKPRNHVSFKLLSLPLLNVCMLVNNSMLVHASLRIDQPESTSPKTPVELNTLMFQGNRVDPARLVARLSSRQQTSSREVGQLNRALNGLGVAIKEQMTIVPGIVVLDAVSLNSRSKKALGALQLELKIKELMATGLFDYVEPNWIYTTQNVPTDTAYQDGTLWGLKNSGQSGGVAGADIDIEPAWALTTGSDRVVVAVIDSGIRYTHQDLSGNMWVNPGEIPDNGVDDDGNGYIDDVYGINAITGSGDPMDDNNHGTHCAGTIGASANDAGYIVGVCWNVSLMALKFLSADGPGTLVDALECIQYATSKGADIMSNSWGGGGYSQALFDAIAAANSAGILFVAAAGNDGRNNDINATYPAGYNIPNVVAVAALDRSDNLAWFSNYGQETVDLGAPGVAIYSSIAASDNAYDSYNGTSMACPHVAGVAALLLANDSGMSVSSLKSRLMESVTPVAALQGVTVTGGRVNARNALSISEDGVMELRAWSDISPLPEDSTVNVYVEVTDLNSVLGASVQGYFEEQTDTLFLDDGSGADATAGDGVYSAALYVPVDVNPVTLTVRAQAYGKSDAEQQYEFQVSAPPGNDQFENRFLLVSGSVTALGSNENASSQEGEALNPSVAGGKTVWWEWVAPVSGEVNITTEGSDYDTTLAVYSGSTLDDLALLDSNDDCIGVRSCVSFTAAAGGQYFLQVDGYAGSEGNIVLNYPPTGDDENAPPTIIAGPASQSVLLGNSFELGVTASGEGTLTYQWYKDGLSLNGAVSSVYEVDQAVLTDAGSYYVNVSNPNGTTRSSFALVVVEQVDVAPGNDFFVAAEELSGSSGRITGIDNSLATGETGEPNHVNNTADPSFNSLWWYFDAPQTGVLSIDTQGSNFDTLLAVYTGSAIDSLNEEAANDQCDESLYSCLELNVSRGQRYYVAVDGYFRRTGLLNLNYTLAPDEVDANNDNFADAAVIAGRASVLQGTNSGASGEDGEPNHAGVSAPLSSVWWRWVAPENATVTVDTYGSNFDTVLGVYLGDSIDSLVSIGANDDSEGLQSRVIFEAISGRGYYIAVDGYGASEGGITLTLNAGASGWDVDSEDLNFGGWRRSPWFGDYVPMDGDWIFHNRHGFWYVFPDSTPDSIFYWTMDMGWLWTSSTTYSYLYRFEPPGWLYYEPNSEDQTRRWFLNLSNGEWEAMP